MIGYQGIGYWWIGYWEIGYWLIGYWEIGILITSSPISNNNLTPLLEYSIQNKSRGYFQICIFHSLD
jgi:hypothetical protein